MVFSTGELSKKKEKKDNPHAVLTDKSNSSTLTNPLQGYTRFMLMFLVTMLFKVISDGYYFLICCCRYFITVYSWWLIVPRADVSKALHKNTRVVNVESLTAAWSSEESGCGGYFVVCSCVVQKVELFFLQYGGWGVMACVYLIGRFPESL